MSSLAVLRGRVARVAREFSAKNAERQVEAQS